MLDEPGSKAGPPRSRPVGMVSTLRRLGWLATLALAGVWIGVGYVPRLDTDWMWWARAGLFVLGAGVIWFAYDPSEDPGA